MKRILFVNDERPIVEMTNLILTRDGYECITALNGVEALELLNSGQAFDLIVCNYQMPLMDGLQVLDYVKEKFPTLPFILHSGDTTVEKIATSRGAIFLSAATKTRDLLNTIQQVLRAAALQAN